MKALVDPNVLAKYVSGWTETGKAIWSTIDNSARVCQVQEDDFPVAPPLFWVDCANGVLPDVWYYDKATQQVLETPAPPPKP